MGWASEYIFRLQDGLTVQFRPRGNSMKGKIESGQLCTVEPVVAATLKVGDIVLCKVNGTRSSPTLLWPATTLRSPRTALNGLRFARSTSIFAGTR
jgi:hypothetical protein